MFLYHNSHSIGYRDPFGAVTPETEINISLDATNAPDDLVCTLRLWIEGQGEQRLVMTPNKNLNRTRFSVSFNAPIDPTLVWYFFILESNGPITKNEPRILDVKS